MASYRRNRLLKEDEQKKSIITWAKKICGIILQILCIAWKSMKIIWYWFERILLIVLLLVLTV